MKWAKFIQYDQNKSGFLGLQQWSKIKLLKHACQEKHQWRQICPISGSKFFDYNFFWCAWLENGEYEVPMRGLVIC